MDNMTFVYMHQEQIQTIYQTFKSSGENLFPAISCGFDDGDVFHVYTARPKVHIAGYICPSAIQFFDTLPNAEEAINRANQICHTIKNQINCEQSENDSTFFVIVFFALSSERLEHKVFIRQGGQLREGLVKFIPDHSDLYSRSKGLLETSVLENCKVGIVGLGSGGSSVALELAKSGVGHFVLIDFDRLELSNISRHVCGIGDLGRYKTKAVRDLLYARNPYITVKTAELDINQHLDATHLLLKDCNVILAATDNDRSRFNLNDIALQHKIPTIFGRALTRAAGGDILRVRPYQSPCLACVFKTGFLKNRQEEVSQFRQARHQNPDYVSDDNVLATIQVGLSSDILPISNMMVKLALVEFSRGMVTGLASLHEDLVADLYIWANRREYSYVNWPKMEYGSRTPSILRWYGAKCERDVTCSVCGNQNQSDDGFFGS